MPKFRFFVLAAMVVSAAAAGILGARTALRTQRVQLKSLRYKAQADALRIARLEQRLIAVRSTRTVGRWPTAPVLNCIKEAIPEVKKDYDAIPSQFQRCRSLIEPLTSSWLPDATEGEQFAFFVAAATSQLGAYGPSDETDVRQIARDPVLNCTQAMLFAAETIKRYYPNLRVTEVALSTPALGLHGFVEVASAQRSFIVDGTTGTIYLVSLDELLAGSRDVPIIDFFKESEPELQQLLEAMTREVRLGRIDSGAITLKKTI